MSAPATVLIVDDEWMLVETIAYNLEKVGFEVLKASDGQEGLSLALECKPQLVILDVMLPYLSGWGVCRALRQDARFASETPIVILTARGDASDRSKSLEAGATDYLTKPFSMNELMARVQSLLQEPESDPHS